MRSIWLPATLLFLAIDSQVAAGRPAEEGVTPASFELVNGLWYTADGFVPKTMYIEGRLLRGDRPPTTDAMIDLGGGYVVPPFGEAHTHRPADPERIAADIAGFLGDGIFYVMNQGSLARYRGALRRLVGRPDSFDALFANALIASPQSHGVELWQRLAARGIFPGVEPSGLDGDAYFALRSEKDMDRRWAEILATEPDFLKIMVEYSEEYERRQDSPEYFGRSGLDPMLLPKIVQRARQEGLRVSAHIETAADFQAVVSAGVDIVAHLPGYDIPADADLGRYRITPAAAAQAARQGTVVVTTTLLSADRAEDDPPRLERMRKNQRHNLELLARSGVTLAVGSDQFSQNAVDELLNLASLGIFDTVALLEMLCITTPRAIFPGRRIGTLEDGAEASFLVLEGNPLEKLGHIRDIALRVKDGRPLPQEVGAGNRSR